MRKSAVLAIFGLVFVSQVFAQEAFIRVVDVGPGLCCVAKLPGNHYLIYDAGLRDNAVAAIEQTIPLGSTIDLLVLSHCDFDHHGCTPFICANYTVRRVIRDGRQGTSSDWTNSVNAIEQEVATEGCEDYNLATADLEPGTRFRFGNAWVMFVCGFCELPDDWVSLDDAETRNAGSIVVRLTCEGRSVLFTGDAVGKHRRGEDNPIATEKCMLDHATAVPIGSDVLVAPHHGGDNASTTDWIHAVNPQFVIFSAGHKHEHPWEVTAQRYLGAGISQSHVFRTDLGDDEGGDEWNDGHTGEGDQIGDDDVGIWIRRGHPIVVQYLARSVSADNKATPRNLTDEQAPKKTRVDCSTQPHRRRILFRRLLNR